jgi:hemerythrin
MLIEWNDDLMTGNGAIDDQHKELFRRFNNLLTACNQGKGRDEVNSMLRFLGEYVRSHFAMEEQLQLRHAYPEYAAHKEEHEGFIRDLKQLESQFSEEGATLTLVIQTNQTMVGWLMRHINGTDRKLAAYLRSAR